MERFVPGMRIMLLLLALMAVEFLVFRKAEPWFRLLFWIIDGFASVCLFFGVPDMVIKSFVI